MSPKVPLNAVKALTVADSSATKAYLKEMGKAIATFNMLGNKAAMESLYGSQGPTAVLSSIPHSPASSILQTREAVLNKLTKNQYRTDDKLESIGRIIDAQGYNSPTIDKLTKYLGHVKPTKTQNTLANLAAGLDTAASFVPLPFVTDIVRPSKYLESKAMHGNSLYNLIPLYTAHKYVAAPKAEEAIINSLAKGQDLSSSDKLLVKLLANRNRL